jgi:hypothetical protein
VSKHIPFGARFVSPDTIIKERDASTAAVQLEKPDFDFV